MAYAAENYIEIDFGWKLADSNGFLDSKLSVGEQVPSEIDTIENQDNQSMKSSVMMRVISQIMMNIKMASKN